MRKNLLLVVLVFSLVLFFSNLGIAQTNDFGLDPVNLEIHPCVGGGLVEVDITINTIEDIQSFVVPLAATGTSVPVLDTILTGGLGDANPVGFNAPSLVSTFTQRIVNPYGIGGYAGGDPMLFVAVSFAGPLVGPASGLYCKMFYNVSGPGTLIFDTQVHSTGGPVTMTRPDASSAPINWGATQTVGTFDVVRMAESAPVVTCPATKEVFVNQTLDIDISATDAGGSAIQGIFLVSGPTCGSGGFSGTNPWVYSWNTTGCLSVSFTESLTFGVYDECETTYCTTDVDVIASAGFVWIGTILNADPCELVEVPVYVDPNKDFGAFDLYIEFDPTLLYFQGIDRGPGLPEGWEYFTYRQLPCPDCGCCKYKLQILGLYDIKDQHAGEYIEAGSGPLEIATLKFKVACDENLRGYDMNICFEFDDGECTENSFSDPTGYILYVSDNPDFFNYDDCDTQAHPENPVLNLLRFYLFSPPGTINDFGRPCGGVQIRTTGEKVRGDINLNLLAYEPADLVLFSSYFIYGDGVFTIDPPVQIANTDINADGHPLSLSDFILMIRIMLHDASAIPKPTPGSDLATIYAMTKGSETKVSTNANLGAALFTFEGVGEVSSDMKIEQGVVDGNLRVLVYMSSSAGVTGELFTVEGAAKLASVEAADNYGRSVKTTVVNKAVPTAFALRPNYPNPFNPVTNVAFALPVDCKVSLKIYNVAGQLVRTLVNETMPAGNHTVTWDGTNSSGEKVASGIYFYKLNAGDFSKTMKMVMTK